MKTVSLKQAFQVPVAGAPSPRIEQGASVQTVAALPEKIPLIKPRLLAKKGERVKIGSPLFENKANTKQRFLSPGGGTIVDIIYGYRRGISQILIETDREEEYQSFMPMDEQAIVQGGRDHLIEELMIRGLWPLIRSLPYRNISSPDERPASLWISLDSADPFQVPSRVYLKGDEEDFVFGVRTLEALGIPVFICESQDVPVEDGTVASLVTHQVSGSYPAEDPGVVLYHTKKSAAENHAWFISGQDVIIIAKGLRTGRYPVSRIMAVAGFTNGNGSDPEINNRYVKTRAGVPLRSLVQKPETALDRRWVTGGLFRGQTMQPDGYMGFYETSLILIEEATGSELFGFLRPGLFKPTTSRTFLYALHKKHFSAKADMRGEERACINCGRCARSCPVDIMVQFTYKFIYAGEIEEALMHGLLDCVECGLCSYVCPAKIELAETLISSKRAYYQERI